MSELNLPRIVTRTSYESYVMRVRSLVGDEVAFSVIVSRLTREARRVYGVDLAQSMLRSKLDRLTFADTPRQGVEVMMPDRDYRMGPVQGAVWQTAGLVMQRFRREAGDDVAFAELFSWTAGLACQVFGGSDAKALFCAMIDSMPEVAKNDLP